MNCVSIVLYWPGTHGATCSSSSHIYRNSIFVVLTWSALVGVVQNMQVVCSGLVLQIATYDLWVALIFC